MGLGGYLTLLNGGLSDWTLGSQHSYQMDAWNWPTVSAGTAARVYVEFGQKGNQKDDGGEAIYNLLQVKASKAKHVKRGLFDNLIPTDLIPDNLVPDAALPALSAADFTLTISLDNVETKTSPKGSQIDLGFRHDQAVNWIMSTDEAGAWWSNSGETIDWMQQAMGSLGNRTLKQIAMPGSHDAGMTRYDPGTFGANFANTQAQYLDIAGQLKVGSRFFDLRPVISNGKFVSGHYSKLGDIGWVGGNGESLEEIINKVNDFTAKYHELIIINISHTLDTDNNWKDLSQDQWNQLFEQLKKINNRYTVANPGKEDFSNKKLGDFITDRASVFVLAQLPGGISLGAYADQGIFMQDNFPFFDSYSESNDLGKMKADQLQKVKDNRNLVADAGQRKDKFHVLSWTLTQGPEDVLNPEKAIMNLGVSAFDDLVVDAFNAFTPESFPNVLYVDALGARDEPVNFPYTEVSKVATTNDITALAMAINNVKAGRNGYVTGR